MTFIPKSIASDTTWHFKYLYKLRFLIVLAIATFLLYTIINQNWLLLAFGIFCLIANYKQYGLPFHQKALYFCEKVIENDKGLVIQQNKISDTIFYHNIANVEYDYYKSFGNYVVTLHLKNPSAMGKTICFVSWADITQYHTKFNWGDKKPTDETLAWIERLKQKINENTQ